MYDNQPGIASHMFEVVGSKLNPTNSNTNAIKKNTAYTRKNVNNWEIIFGVNETGKLTITAWKTIGKGQEGQESKIHITLESTSNRVPIFVKTNYYDAKKGGYQPFVEIDDAKGRVADSYKNEEQYYKRQFHKSSILTTEEFLSEQVPGFEELLIDKRLNQYVHRIADECSLVQKPYNRDYMVINK